MAERIRIGVSQNWRISLQVTQPFIPGIIKSRIITSGECFLVRSIPSCPELAIMTSEDSGESSNEQQFRHPFIVINHQYFDLVHSAIFSKDLGYRSNYLPG